ncbi:MAG TPA: DUF2184 domain-containing protein [Gaiellaceae bacterium]
MKALTFNNFDEARAAFAADRALHEQYGIFVGPAVSYLPEMFRRNDKLAMDAMIDLGLAADAQPALGTDPNSALPAMLTTFVDPAIYKWAYTPNKTAEILGEQRKGDWTTDTAMFPVVEQTGEVSTYGDFAQNGRAGVNMNWPQFQQYRYQTIIEYGDLETERAGLGKINYVAELQASGSAVMSKFENTVYSFGVQGLQNYGVLNNPYLSAALTPATKVAGGTAWDNATANEIFDDVKAVITDRIKNMGGLVDTSSRITIALGPSREALFAATNSFNVNVSDLLKKNYPNLRIVTAVQYEALSASNPQGNAAGNLMQVIFDEVEGQKTGFSAFSEKLRAHRLVPDLSSFKQKRSAGAWGSIIRMPVAIGQMVGI